MMDLDGWKELALSIVAQMVKDYYTCLYHIERNDFTTPKKKLETIKAAHDYESFFKSDRFYLYSNYSGEAIIRTVKERVKKEYENENFNNKEI